MSFEGNKLIESQKRSVLNSQHQREGTIKYIEKAHFEMLETSNIIFQISIELQILYCFVSV